MIFSMPSYGSFSKRMSIKDLTETYKAENLEFCIPDWSYMYIYLNLSLIYSLFKSPTIQGVLVSESDKLTHKFSNDYHH
jgi:hypothetical protein